MKRWLLIGALSLAALGFLTAGVVGILSSTQSQLPYEVTIKMPAPAPMVIQLPQGPSLTDKLEAQRQLDKRRRLLAEATHYLELAERSTKPTERSYYFNRYEETLARAMEL
jgi:hypothetical protein